MINVIKDQLSNRLSCRAVVRDHSLIMPPKAAKQAVRRSPRRKQEEEAKAEVVQAAPQEVRAGRGRKREEKAGARKRKKTPSPSPVRGTPAVAPQPEVKAQAPTLSPEEEAKLQEQLEKEYEEEEAARDVIAETKGRMKLTFDEEQIRAEDFNLISELFSLTKKDLFDDWLHLPHIVGVLAKNHQFDLDIEEEVKTAPFGPRGSFLSQMTIAMLLPYAYGTVNNPARPTSALFECRQDVLTYAAWTYFDVTPTVPLNHADPASDANPKIPFQPFWAYWSQNKTLAPELGLDKTTAALFKNSLNYWTTLWANQLQRIREVVPYWFEAMEIILQDETSALRVAIDKVYSDFKLDKDRFLLYLPNARWTDDLSEHMPAGEVIDEKATVAGRENILPLDMSIIRCESAEDRLERYSKLTPEIKADLKAIDQIADKLKKKGLKADEKTQLLAQSAELIAKVGDHLEADSQAKQLFWVSTDWHPIPPYAKYITTDKKIQTDVYIWQYLGQAALQSYRDFFSAGIKGWYVVPNNDMKVLPADGKIGLENYSFPNQVTNDPVPPKWFEG